MAKFSSTFVCQSCGSISNKWSGKCEACGEWNTIVEERMEATPKGLAIGKGRTITFEALNGKDEEAPRLSTNIVELDRVLGGGLVQGSAVLIGGDPGTGKSTLLLQAAVALSRNTMSVAYISGEESIAQVRLRAKRLGFANGNVLLAAATSVRDILLTLEKTPDLSVAIIDSIQTMYVDNIESAPGTVAQVRASAHELIKLAKKKDLAIFFVGHVTKDGQIAGPRVLEHMVDTVLYFEGDRGHQFRILRAVKNRFGGTDEIGVFEMTGEGLKEVANPSALFLSQRNAHVSGSAVFAGMEGTRPVLMEIQALVAPSPMATPRRAVVGWDAARLALVLAVLEARAGVFLGDKEVYLNVAGGLRIAEPAADLAVAAALLSALTDVPVPEDSVFFGEIGLSGEIRQVSRSDARIKESEKLGFLKAYTAPGAAAKSTLGIHAFSHVQELRTLFGQDTIKRTRQG